MTIGNQKSNGRREGSGSAYVYAFGAVLCWSTVASAFKLTLGELRVVPMLAFASAASSLSLLLLLALRRGRILSADWNRRSVMRSAVSGFINPFLYYIVLFSAYDRLPAQEAQPLNYTWPIVLTLLSALVFHQRVAAAEYAAMGVSFAGVVILSTRGKIAELQVTDPLGVTLALGSSVVWATYWVLTMRSGHDPVETLFLNMLFGMVFAFLLALVVGWGRVSIAGVAGAVYIGVFEMGVTFVLWLSALRRAVTTARVANLVFVSPFFSLIVIHVVVGEPIYPSTAVGLILVVGGLLLQQVVRQRSSQRTESKTVS
ncbi:MAG: DMT family transporter [Bacteroidota bacterium]|nr:DMT family transporter [Bacteroidota bacterium]